MKSFLVLFSLFLSSCLSLSEKRSDLEVAGVYHRVKKGDSLSRLATRYRSTVEEIKEVNGIESERSLRVGQEIFIPDPDPIGARINKYSSKPIASKKAKKPSARKNIASSKKTSEQYGEKIFSFPVPGGQIVRSFSDDKKKPHDGITIRAQAGSPILAAQKGKIIFVGDDGTRFGLLVLIEHKEPYISVYTHLEKAVVKSGQYVEEGQTIGTVGTSGGLKSPQLHFQIRVAQRPKDPEKYLKNKPLK